MINTKAPLTMSGAFVLYILRFIVVGAPTEIRTPVLALKGLRPGPLDDGGFFVKRAVFYHPLSEWSSVFLTIFQNSWLINTLVFERQQVNVLAVKENCGAVHFQRRNENRCQQCIINWHKIACTLDHDNRKIKTA